MKELIEFILFVFISGLICNGWYLATRIGMVFGFWEKYWEQFTQIDDQHPAVHKYPEWLRKPISSCVICFASIYGTIIFVSVMQWEGYKTILIWIAYVFSLAYMNNFLHNQLLKSRK